jgi:hypothetical protein
MVNLRKQIWIQGFYARCASRGLSRVNYFLSSRQLYVEAIGACSKDLSICSSCRGA